MSNSNVSSSNLELWRSYPGVTWDTSANGVDPVPFKGSVAAPICGIHFDARGRAFVSTPRLITADSPATLSLLDVDAKTGPARLTAFPSVEANAVATKPDENLRTVLGFYVDNTNDWIWVLDMGYVAGDTEAPVGAQKVMIYNLETGAVVKRIPLDGAADPKSSFLNDIAVDEKRKVGYISDSGMRSAPTAVGIIVIDFATGHARRVLNMHPSVQVAPDVTVMSQGAQVFPGSPMKLGINGIALSPDADTLYWTVTTGLVAHSAPTEVLRDPKSTDAAIEASVREIGNVGGNTDGIVTDATGNLLITDVTHGGIVKYDPTTQKLELIASDSAVHWPDTATIDPSGDLVFTSSNLNNHFAGAVKAGEERYDLWRLKLGK